MIGIGKTNIGMLRKGNEDTVFVLNSEIGILPNLYIVADGMGGHKAGDIASTNAVEYFCKFIAENTNGGVEDILDTIVDGTKFANKKVFEMAREKEEYNNMGTTFLAAVACENKLFIAHIGDCRLYIARNGKLNQVTTDHTYVMEMVKSGVISLDEAETHPDRNIITRALGVDEEISVDGIIVDFLPGDIAVMCSDGLYEMVSFDEMVGTINNDCLTFEEKVDKLIYTANFNGGRDNISVVLISQ